LPSHPDPSERDVSREVAKRAWISVLAGTAGLMLLLWAGLAVVLVILFRAIEGSPTIS
jgi:hypothetical protein